MDSIDPAAVLCTFSLDAGASCRLEVGLATYYRFNRGLALHDMHAPERRVLMVLCASATWAFGELLFLHCALSSTSGSDEGGGYLKRGVLPPLAA